MTPLGNDYSTYLCTVDGVAVPQQPFAIATVVCKWLLRNSYAIYCTQAGQVINALGDWHKCHINRLSYYPMVSVYKDPFGDFKNWILRDCHIIRCHIIREALYPRERKEGGTRVWILEKGNLQKWMRDTGFSDPVAFKLDHFQPVKLILFQKNPLKSQPPTLNHFLLPQIEQGRREQGLKIKRELSKNEWETHGFLTLGHSNWTIFSLLN